MPQESLKLIRVMSDERGLDEKSALRCVRDLNGWNDLFSVVADADLSRPLQPFVVDRVNPLCRLPLVFDSYSMHC